MKKKISTLLRWVLLCAAMGVCCGILGAAFSHGVSWVTAARERYAWLVFLLPLVAPLSVFLYRRLRVEGVGTNQVLLAADGKETLSWRLIPAVFFGSLLSHLFGASVGREGAALQMGGSLSALFGRIFKATEKEGETLVYCGMAGLFSAVFGTPFAAFVFALEVVFVGEIPFFAAVPTFFTSILAYVTSRLLKTHPERFLLASVPSFSWSIVLKVLLVAVGGALTSVLFCFALKYAKKLFRKGFKNPYLRIVAGGVLIVAATLLLGTKDYNGAGVSVIERIFAGGTVVGYAFLLKILLTAVSVGAGFQGGEIVPSLFVGATMGSTLALFLGIPLPFGAAIGMISVFCGVTNCPLASIAVGLELFSGKASGYLIVAAVVSFLISGKISLYSAQKTKGFKQKF